MRMDSITLEEVKQHLYVDSDEEDMYIFSLLEASKHFILSQTGLSESDANSKEDLGIACLCVIADMYENRGMTTGEKLESNVIYDSIVSQYCINLL